MNRPLRWTLPLLLLVGALAVGSTTALRADEDEPEADPATEAGDPDAEEAGIQWLKSLEEATASAKAQDKVVFLYFGRENPG